LSFIQVNFTFGQLKLTIMRIKYLLPYNCRWIGSLLIFGSGTLEEYCRVHYSVNESFDLPLTGGDSALLSPGHLLSVTQSLLLLAGLFLIAFSKEKIEDEQISQLRLDSLRWAIYFYYFVIVLNIIFIRGSVFCDMLRLSTWVPLLFFIFRFRWVIYRLSK